MARFRWCLGLWWGLFSAACGGGDDGGEATLVAGRGGQITEAWRAYCVATFTTDYQVTEFDEPLFTARAGEEYLLTSYGSSVDDYAELAYLTPLGPYTFEIRVPADSRAFPFTTACTFGDTTQYYAAFTDVVLYDTAELTQELCTLPAESVVLRDPSLGASFGLTTVSLSGPLLYEVRLNAFSERCGGASSGFVSVPRTELFDFTTALVPIIVIIGS